MRLHYHQVDQQGVKRYFGKTAYVLDEGFEDSVE